jgi:ribose/xylose/arabinose/galactoside ABC-type transport system permease subunit
VKDLVRRSWFGPLVALVVVYVLFSTLAPDTFLRASNLGTMARQTVVVGLGTAGMTLVMVMGGIDLSVGSTVALSTVILARCLQAGTGPALGVLAAVALAALVGMANGVMVTGLRITPFIVTLGTMSVLRGLAKGLAHEQKVDVDPGGLDSLMTVGGAWLPHGVWVTLGIAVLAAFLLAFTRFGRHVVAVGSNELTARLCGVAVARVKITVYALAGLVAGVAGLMEFATLTVGDPTDSIGLELEVIAAVVIGGGSLSGGQGSIAGSLVGALLLTVIKTGSTHVGLPNWVQEILTGCIIVVAMAVDRYRRRARG